MTGYGSARLDSGAWRWTAEIRSVNHRFLELRINLPRDLARYEAELRKLVQGEAQRGKVDVNLNVSGRAQSAVQIQVNLPLARAYVAAWRQLQRELGVPGEVDLGMLVERSDLVSVSETPRDSEEDARALREVLGRALRAWNQERAREGRALQRDMHQRVVRLATLQRQIAACVRKLKPVLRERLRRRVAALLDDRALDEQRLLQEVVLIAERSDVNEELVRLQAHLAACRTLLREKGPVGKRLEFLLQELHREFNTIASKSSDLTVTQLTIEARSEIEKLKEQVQNVE